MSAWKFCPYCEASFALQSTLNEHIKEVCGPRGDKARIAELEAALRAIFLAADNAGNEREWADMVSAEMTDKRRALVSD